MHVCNAMTQSELDSHGRSDYDVTLDGDKPCFFIGEHDNITSEIRMDCTFDDPGAKVEHYIV